ncbi:hypothetical protein SY83_08270 [Paenibacillus swuensis]|uniref:LUD domain-containing protein n=1 Tax=Paenibacillus swuensis TaxID=1178515 RepID=A0A172TGU7_9BACL|nr:LUD domain-containing protein [Paenibacillus swuensis]ANE46269.1 hypothetical protein SY83_08270 [Paenibacillus swuensis]
MSNPHTHEAWLNQLETESRRKQEAFIANITNRLNRPFLTEPPAHPYRGAPAYWNEWQWSVPERIEHFSTHFRNAGGHVRRMNQYSEAKQFILEHAEALGAQWIIRNDQPLLNTMELEAALPSATVSIWNRDPAVDWKARSAEADIGIVVADHAVAYTGSIVVRSSATQGRSVSLLPTVLIVILPLERLQTRLGEVLVGLDEAGREHLPAGLHFISGPSRSADIENDLTIGVHGPGIVYTLIVG